MKPRNFIISGLLICFCLVLNSSCDFDETNKPLEITEVTLDQLLPAAVTQLARNQLSESGRSAGIVMQYFDGFDTKTYLVHVYRIFEDHFNTQWNNGFYSGSILQAKTLADQAKLEGKPNYEAIGKIIMAHEFGVLIAQFGAIPFSQACLGNQFLQPEYDSQESVYAGIDLLLDEAIALINQGDTETPGFDDYIYKGNMELWEKLPYALKARFLLQTSNRHPENFEQILDIVQNRTFSGMEEHAVFDWGLSDGFKNPTFTFHTERPNTRIMHLTLIDSMLVNEDPRLETIAVTDGYDWFVYDEDYPQKLFWAREDSRIPVVSFAEIKFMEAECLLRTGGSLADISGALKEAIEVSFTQMEMAAFLYQDFIDLHADLSDLPNDDEILKHIMDEAFVAYYGYGFQQTWDNYKRLSLPALTPNPWGAWSGNPSGGIPLRFPYPESERTFNTENVQTAIDRQNGALLDTPLWAFE